MFLLLCFSGHIVGKRADQRNYGHCFERLGTSLHGSHEARYSCSLAERLLYQGLLALKFL